MIFLHSNNLNPFNVTLAGWQITKLAFASGQLKFICNHNSILFSQHEHSEIRRNILNKCQEQMCTKVYERLPTRMRRNERAFQANSLAISALPEVPFSNALFRQKIRINLKGDLRCISESWNMHRGLQERYLIGELNKYISK